MKESIEHHQFRVYGEAIARTSWESKVVKPFDQIDTKLKPLITGEVQERYQRRVAQIERKQEFTRLSHNVEKLATIRQDQKHTYYLTTTIGL